MPTGHFTSPVHHSHASPCIGANDRIDNAYGMHFNQELNAPMFFSLSLSEMHAVPITLIPIFLASSAKPTHAVSTVVRVNCWVPSMVYRRATASFLRSAKRINLSHRLSCMQTCKFGRRSWPIAPKTVTGFGKRCAAAITSASFDMTATSQSTSHMRTANATEKKPPPN